MSRIAKLAAWIGVIGLTLAVFVIGGAAVLKLF